MDWQTLLQPYRDLGRSGLLPALHAVQQHLGWIPPEAAAQVARSLNIPLADVYGVITFYALFYDRPVGRTVLRVCTGPVCQLHGSQELLERLQELLQAPPGEPSADGQWTVEAVPCLGMCDHPVAGLRGLEPRVSLKPQHPQALMAEQAPYPVTHLGGTVRRLLAGIRPDRGPLSLQEYQNQGGYLALERALRLLSPKQVRQMVQDAGLWGRGGAAFPTGLKWEYTAQAQGQPKYVVCNADESEPGTFKDRVLLEGNPHLVLEGLLLAGYAVGAARGYVYVRGEYLPAYRALERALDEARQAGLVGERILGSEFSFEIELRRGAGAYICGEETALFESIEGKRGYPRLKPPYPTTHGLFGKPTAINNVETLANVPWIVREGPEAYRQWGTEDSPGTKLFSLSGDVQQPGVYEAPFGITLGELVELAGGFMGEPAALLVGGAAGVFVEGHDLNWPLTLEEGRRRGVPVGTGTIMVFNRQRDLRQVLLNLAAFFAEESCGKCFPCQLGTQRQLELLQRVFAGQGRPADLALLQDIGHTMTEASICGLGQTAALAWMSAFRLWPHLFNGHAT